MRQNAGVAASRMRLVNQTRPMWSNIGLCGVVCDPHNGLSPQYGDGWFRKSSCCEMNMPRGLTGVRVKSLTCVVVWVTGSSTGTRSVESSVAP